MEIREIKGLNREILRLSIPSILANITVPLVGMVDTAVAGHLPASSEVSNAAFIGSIAVGSMMLNLMYWMVGFLRTSTGGLTAQAYGSGNLHECARIFGRAVGLAALVAAFILLVQWPFGKLALMITRPSSDVYDLAFRYFLVRIWAAPATISLFAFRGWFVGMQDSISSMTTDLVINVVNILSSVLLSFGIGSWNGMGFDGIALGTVVAQFTGLAYAVCAVRFKYGRSVFAGLRLRDCFRQSELGGFMSMNVDFIIRSLCFTVIYMGETMIAARFGDIYLACNAIIMNLLMIFSYFTDGFAYAGEALTGRFIGGHDRLMLVKSVRYVFMWSMALGVLFVGIYAVSGVPLLRFMTSDAEVVDCCRQYLPWLMLMPPLGCAAFAWDGIYMGATASKGIRNSMIAAMVAFLGVWYGGSALLHPHDAGCLHLLMAAYFAHLLARTVLMSLNYKTSVLGRL